MKISELKSRQGKVDIIVEIVDVGEAREFTKFGKTGKVATATAKDDSGEIKLSLWNEQIDKVQKGSKVQIKNGYVSEWQGDMQLTTGRFGTFEVVEGGVDVEAVKEEKKQKLEEGYEKDKAWEEPSSEEIEDDAKNKGITEEEVVEDK